ncbi:MAG: glycine betaine ABC transporter substrate-binding protein [Devosia sp.]|nr:glycine betaine ABC transporter substrate-binding protein [Devosia sp.]
MRILSRPLVAALAVMLLIPGLAVSARAQQVPPLATPDVTNLVAPGGGDSSSVPVPGTDNGAVPADAASGPDGLSDTGAPPPCGTRTITIARMAWPSAALLAEIHARLLETQFGCVVQVLPSDLAPTISGMALTGQPAVAPEMWPSRVADHWNEAVKEQKLRQVGLSYAESQFEGWYVPDYVAAAHPELKSVAALKDDWKLFAGGGTKGKFVSCPADWACAVINRNLLKAEGLDELYTVVEPKNRFDLDQMIAAAVSRKQPILFYYWQPNATLAQFSFKPVDLGAYSKDDFACLGKKLCEVPKPSSFAPEPVVIALAEWVFTGAPEVAAYFQRAQMPMAEMNSLLAQLNETGATVEAVADKFVAERQEVWQKWVGAPAAKPVTGAPSAN